MTKRSGEEARVSAGAWRFEDLDVLRGDFE